MVSLSIANVANKPEFIQRNTELFGVTFNFDQLLGISKSYQDLQKSASMDDNIFNFRLLNNLSNTISNLAVEKLSNDLRSYLTKCRPVKPPKQSPKHPNSDDHPQKEEQNPNNIFDNPLQNFRISCRALSSLTHW